MYGKLLVAVDLDHGEAGYRLLRLARELGGPGAAVTAVFVLDPVPGYVAAQIPEGVVEGHRAEARERLAALVAAADPAAGVELRQGAPAQGILDAAEALGVDAILIASHRPGLADYLIGSTASRVVRHAKCTVVVERSS